MASTIVKNTLAKLTIPVVEVNLESCIEDGFAIVINEKSEISLPKLFLEI